MDLTGAAAADEHDGELANRLEEIEDLKRQLSAQQAWEDAGIANQREEIEELKRQLSTLRASDKPMADLCQQLAEERSRAKKATALVVAKNGELDKRIEEIGDLKRQLS